MKNVCSLVALFLSLTMTSPAVANTASSKEMVASESSSKHLKGKFVRDRYYDPTGIFSVIVPEDYRDAFYEAPDCKDGKSRVMFGNSSLGIAMSLYVETFSDQGELKEMQKDKPAIGALLKDLYHDITLPSFNEYHDTHFQVVHQEGLSSETKGPGFFAIVKMPERYKCACNDGERYLAKYMGHLLFFEDQQLVVLAYDLPEVVSCNVNIALIRNALQRMQGSYRNETKR